MMMATVIMTVITWAANTVMEITLIINNNYVCRDHTHKLGCSVEYDIVVIITVMIIVIIMYYS